MPPTSTRTCGGCLPASFPLSRPITGGAPFPVRSKHAPLAIALPLAVRVADGAGERVGGVRSGRALQRQQPLHHLLHLLLGGVAVPDHRLLHLQRGVLGDRQAGEHRGADRGAARLAERKGRLRVGVDEYLLDRDHCRGMLGDHAVQPLEDHLQPHRELARAGLDAAAGDVTQVVAARFDHAEARYLQARVDAENLQSSTAVVYTSCTSSRPSSASSRLFMRPASPPASALSLTGFMTISASSGLSFAWSSASFTARKSAGAHSSSTEPSSFLSTSSAPASSPASSTASSLVPGANTNCPQCLKR